MLEVISNPFIAWAKHKFTSLFGNQHRDTSFRIVSFFRFLFITFNRNKTSSDEIEERGRDIQGDLSTRLVLRHLSISNTFHQNIKIQFTTQYSMYSYLNHHHGTAKEDNIIAA